MRLDRLLKQQAEDGQRQEGDEEVEYQALAGPVTAQGGDDAADARERLAAEAEAIEAEAETFLAAMADQRLADGRAIAPHPRTVERHRGCAVAWVRAQRAP